MSTSRHREMNRQEKEIEMNKRKILTLVSTVAILIAPAAFYAATQYQRSAASTGGPDYMATELVWAPKAAEPDYMATEFVWVPKDAEPDYMATEFVWIPMHAQPAGLRLAGAEQAR